MPIHFVIIISSPGFAILLPTACGSFTFSVNPSTNKSEINEFNLIKAENEKDTIKLVEINNNGKKSIFVLSVSETNRTSLRYGDKLLKIDNTPIHETNYSLNDLVKII